jgi:dTDP-4-amino-4,6-dideoxygalactose transaminase
VVDRHRFNAQYYADHLDSYFETPTASQLSYDTKSSYWLYTIRLPSQEKRQEFAQWMLDRGVHVSQVHARNDYHPAFMENMVDAAGLCRPLPGLEEFYAKMICLPVHQALTNDDLATIVRTANLFAAQKK